MSSAMAEETPTVDATKQDTSFNPILAGLISLVIPGVGHLMAGQQSRGLGWFIGTVVFYVITFFLTAFLVGILLWLFIPFIHIGAGVDAFLQARK
jgi:TM2 domain-containing membrane protein YozV